VRGGVAVATVAGLAATGALRVRLPDGTSISLDAGEVRLLPGP
jgi:hypothetical protein